MTMTRVQGTIGMSVVIIALCIAAALMWVGVGGLVGCSIAGVLAGLVFVIVEKSPNRRL